MEVNVKIHAPAALSPGKEPSDRSLELATKTIWTLW